MPIKLYDFPLSGNCYKIRLMLSMLGLEYECIHTDILAGDTLTAEFKQLNPRGQIPLLQDDDAVIWDSMAILVYLARQYGDERWLPQDALQQARVMQWLAVSENELLFGLARARVVKLFNRPFNFEQCQAEAKAGLATIEEQLATQTWLATEHPTIADVACYPYISLAHDAEIDISDYPNIQRWMADFESLSGWVSQID